jgi:predicted enzyme related to lactoylglutathione lyase
MDAWCISVEMAQFHYCSCLLHFFFQATLRVSGAMQKSAEVMKSMQELIKVSDIAATMRDMSKEMMKVTSYIRNICQLFD